MKNAEKSGRTEKLLNHHQSYTLNIAEECSTPPPPPWV